MTDDLKCICGTDWNPETMQGPLEHCPSHGNPRYFAELLNGAKAEIVRLQEALKPFAAAAGAFDGFGNDFVAYIDLSPSVDWITAKDFRNAKQALGEQP